MKNTEETVIVNIDPSEFLVDSNVRYGLLPGRIRTLANDILDKGGVMVAIEAETLEQPVDGKSYRVVDGHYRHAAVNLLNTEQGAGLTLPCVMREPSAPVDRIKRQISANINRQDMTPIDRAYAMKSLMDAGVTREEIRNIFATSGGRKGNKVQPLSNASLNMHVSFLELPKKYRDMIHSGEIGVGAAYELTKVAPENRQAVAEAALAERERQIAKELAADEKYAAVEAKVEEAVVAISQTDTELDTLKASKTQAEQALADAEQAAADAYKATKKAKTDEAKAEAEAAHAAAKKVQKKAEKDVLDCQKAIDKLEGKKATLAQTVEERKAKLLAAMSIAAKDKKAKPINNEDIKKASVAQGVSEEHVPLKAMEMRQFAQDLSLPAGDDSEAGVLLQKTGQIVKACFDGVITDNQAFARLKKLYENTLAGKAKKAA